MGADCGGFRRISRQRERQGRRKETQACPKEVREIYGRTKSEIRATALEDVKQSPQLCRGKLGAILVSLLKSSYVPSLGIYGFGRVIESIWDSVPYLLSKAKRG